MISLQEVAEFLKPICLLCLLYVLKKLYNVNIFFLFPFDDLYCFIYKLIGTINNTFQICLNSKACPSPIKEIKKINRGERKTSIIFLFIEKSLGCPEQALNHYREMAWLPFQKQKIIILRETKRVSLAFKFS